MPDRLDQAHSLTQERKRRARRIIGLLVVAIIAGVAIWAYTAHEPDVPVRYEAQTVVSAKTPSFRHCVVTFQPADSIILVDVYEHRDRQNLANCASLQRDDVINITVTGNKGTDIEIISRASPG